MFSGSRSSLPKMAILRALWTEKLIFSPKTLRCSIDLTPKPTLASSDAGSTENYWSGIAGPAVQFKQGTKNTLKVVYEDVWWWWWVGLRSRVVDRIQKRAHHLPQTRSSTRGQKSVQPTCIIALALSIFLSVILSYWNTFVVWIVFVSYVNTFWNSTRGQKYSSPFSPLQYQIWAFHTFV